MSHESFIVESNVFILLIDEILEGWHSLLNMVYYCARQLVKLQVVWQRDALWDWASKNLGCRVEDVAWFTFKIEEKGRKLPSQSTKPLPRRQLIVTVFSRDCMYRYLDGILQNYLWNANNVVHYQTGFKNAAKSDFKNSGITW